MYVYCLQRILVLGSVFQNQGATSIRDYLLEEYGPDSFSILVDEGGTFRDSCSVAKILKALRSRWVFGQIWCHSSYSGGCGEGEVGRANTSLHTWRTFKRASPTYSEQMA